MSTYRKTHAWLNLKTAIVSVRGLCFIFWIAFAAIGNAQVQRAGEQRTGAQETGGTPKLETAIFGGGCFWCIEAVFERVWGVHSVVSGYAGGNVRNPTYEMVSTDRTGHAEVCRIEYDSDIVTYEELLRIFFKSHDPTILNGQGPDRGTRYRSVVLYQNDDEKEVIRQLLEEFKEKRTFKRKIVTEISPLNAFFAAEEYHQDYFAKHPHLPYCEMNIRPKIGKFERSFKENSKLQQSKLNSKPR